MRALLKFGFMALCLSAVSTTGFAQNQRMPTEGPVVGFEPGTLETKWIHGSANCLRNTDPAIQVHHYNDNLVILRQNKCVNFEAPFMYLIFGAEKAILVDSGATRSATTFPIQKTVESLLLDHYGEEGRQAITLVVAHSHGHGDHVAGDSQFAGKPGTTVVGLSANAVKRFFNIGAWPASATSYDLGGRKLQIMPIPGHEDSHIAIYDEQTGLLLTGDTLYPGRLYVQDWSTYRTSVSRLVSYMAGKNISHVLGAHIELSTTPGVDYPMGSTFQEYEHDLPLTFEHLQLLDSRLKTLGSSPKFDVQDDFIIYPN